MKMFIHGEERDSRDSAVIEVVNPYNGKLLDTVPAATREDVTECITWAVEGQKTWNQKNIREKSEVLKKFVGLVKEKREHQDRLARYRQELFWNLTSHAEALASGYYDYVIHFVTN